MRPACVILAAGMAYHAGPLRSMLAVSGARRSAGRHQLWLESRWGAGGGYRYVSAWEFSAGERGERAGTAVSFGWLLGADLPVSRAVSVRGDRLCAISANHQVPVPTHDHNNPFIVAVGQGACSAHRSTAASVTQLISSTHATRTRRCLNMRAWLPAAVAITPFLHHALGGHPAPLVGRWPGNAVACLGQAGTGVQTKLCQE